MTLLHRLYPELAAPYPCLPLASLPTPVTETEAFAGNGARVFIKHDEATSPLYGGNKARKLGWLLGAAAARGA
ncbi:MAG TPA: 1-aminocyclopropane-1-carboxylate deaminase, partial [Candidatus Hydrogenedentes bacterium]|nr:1-aminocyclopropane-1-carboxylate deaminase [Candidatus Hydrogenedentota bacterium]